VREVNSYDSGHSGTSLSAIALIEVNQSLSLADDGAFRRPFIKRSIPPFAALAISPKNQASGSRRILRLPDPAADSTSHCAVAQ
jgi:hypothetical protein